MNSNEHMGLHLLKRRTFLQRAAVGALGLSLPDFRIPPFMADVPMGIVVHSYAYRWNSKHQSQKYPGFSDALQLLEHCHQLGGGGVQVGVSNWSLDFAKKVRDKREQWALYLEGSIGLPKDANDLEAFETEVKNAKEAGAKILRTVCLSGRRYEAFHSLDEFEEFKNGSLRSLQLAEPVVRKYKVRLAVENHKDWRAPELAQILKEISSEWVGVTLDFGNSIALLEDPMEVVRTLVPYIFTTHVKDMALAEYGDGFLLSEVPLGQGMLDLPKMVDLCRTHNPQVTFNLEMITRDPLEIPCLQDAFWQTFEGVPGMELARSLRMVRNNQFPGELPKVSHLQPEQRLAREEENVVASLAYSKKHLIP